MIQGPDKGKKKVNLKFFNFFSSFIEIQFTNKEKANFKEMSLG